MKHLASAPPFHVKHPLVRDAIARSLRALGRTARASRADPGAAGRDPAASTTVRDPAAAVDGTSRTRSSHSISRRCEPPASLADLGSGAGWPGLALAVALPAARVYPASRARCARAVLDRAVAAAGLENVEVVHARAEEWDVRVRRGHGPGAGGAAGGARVRRAAAGRGWSCGGLEGRGRRARGGRRRRRCGWAARLEPVEVRRVTPYAGARDHSLHVFRRSRPRRRGSRADRAWR